MRSREGHVGEHVGLGVIEEDRELGQLRAYLVGNPAPLRSGGLGVVRGEGGADEGGDDAPATLAGMRQGIAHEVHTAALPGGIEHFGNGRLDALMGIGDYELDTTQPAACQLAQEGSPKRLGFRGADVEPENFAAPIAVDADRDNDGDGDDAAVLAYLHVGGVDPQVWPV